jgi:hypothetical protein
MQALLIYVCALVLVDTIFFAALTPLLQCQRPSASGPERTAG